MGAWLKPNLDCRDRRSDSFAAPGTAPVFDAFCGCQPPSGPIVFLLNTEVHSPPLQSRWVFFMGELRSTRHAIRCYWSPNPHDCSIRSCLL